MKWGTEMIREAESASQVGVMLPGTRWKLRKQEEQEGHGSLEPSETLTGVSRERMNDGGSSSNQGMAIFILGIKGLKGNRLVLLKNRVGTGFCQNTKIPVRNSVRNFYQGEHNPLMEESRWDILARK